MRPNEPEELHIASAVVHCAPKRLDAVSAGVAAMPGATVHASAPEGKLAVTLEAASADEVTGCVSSIQRLDGVFSVALVYQCADSLTSMNEELSDAPTRLR